MSWWEWAIFVFAWLAVIQRADDAARTAEAARLELRDAHEKIREMHHSIQSIAVDLQEIKSQTAIITDDVTSHFDRRMAPPEPSIPFR